MNTRFRDFLFKLGFSEEEVLKELRDNEFNHSIGKGSLSVKYIYASSESEIFDSHQRLWNQNAEPVFIAVSDNKSHLINAKEKPDKERPLKKSICIQSFDYGINTGGYEDVDALLISKIQIDSSYFFNFVSQSQRKRNTVDKDLLLNLLTLKSDLIDENNSHIIHLLILRCLFIKYLEDRGIFDKNYLLNKLESGKAAQLVDAFDQVARINGDVFKYDQHFQVSDIRAEHLEKIALFFKCDYRSGQQYLFPYKFNYIPIQLISHVYEAFLKTSVKKGGGVYYTPSFLVDFMLERSFAKVLEKNNQASLFDPAVGSGAFLVQAFKLIEKTQGGNLSFEGKKQILQNQLFGIDVDANALQITAFSLYLALLETEDSAFIKVEIERANPILPSLIGKTLIHANTILDGAVFEGQTFSCIVSNPPWGSVPTTSEDDNVKKDYQKEREAIDNKQGIYPEYDYVADYERSQAFIGRVARWGDETTVYTMVVKNSIFLNDKSLNFRQYLLDKYTVNEFYELSHYNRILFKKTPLGKINGKKIELGASEPCAVLTFKNRSGEENVLNYISPKLTNFSEQFDLIHYNSTDHFELQQAEFIENDSLWKVLVHGDTESHELLIEKLAPQRNLIAEVRRGFIAKKNMISLGDPIWKRKIEPSHFEQFNLKTKELDSFNWNQEMERKRKDESIFRGKRIVLPIGPTKEDGFQLRGLYLKDEVVFKDNMLSVKLKGKADYIDNYLPYLGIFNSQLIGFMIYQLSVQWGKGKTWVNLRNEDIENLPFKEITDTQVADDMTSLVEIIQTKKSQALDCQTEIDQLNEMVFDLYGLVEYEKEIIREFYDVRVKRAGKQESLVRSNDITEYFEAFKDAYSLMLSNDKTLNATYHISKNMGAVICISINEKLEEKPLERDTTLDILNLVKSKQLTDSDSLKVLFEEKVKIYNKDLSKFYIIKSNQFKDWTVRQAMKDAKEEIDAFIKYLPTT